jgi:hypothetical protein
MDKNYLSISDQHIYNLEGVDISPVDAREYDDILKISGSTNVRIRSCFINRYGGNREDGVDIMRLCRDVIIEDCSIRAGGKYAVTIKGGSSKIWLTDVIIVGSRGSEGVDIDIGNYNHVVPNAKTGKVVLENVTREDGQPVRVRVGFAEKPLVIGGNVKILFWQSLALKAYVWFKRNVWPLNPFKST